jgi:hypothetical protein
MPYLKAGVEYLTAEDNAVYQAIVSLNGEKRTTNNSQIARVAGMSATKVGDITTHLRMRKYIKDVSRGAAYHWRTTDKPAVTEATI